MADTDDFIKNFQEIYADEIKDLKPLSKDKNKQENKNEWFQAASNYKDIDESIETPKQQPEPPKANLSDDDINTKALLNGKNQFGKESELIVVYEDVGVKEETESSIEIIDISQYPDYLWTDINPQDDTIDVMGFEELEEIKNDLETSRKTLDDFGTLFTIDTDKDGKIIYTSIRNAEFKKDKIYLNDQIKEQRIITLENKNGLKAYINRGEYLGDIIDILPYGLIDKKITGIGATSLELESKRNSIIIMPTKTLAYNKHESLENKNDVLLCIGSGYLKVEPINIFKIQDYIKRTDVSNKKIIVVADSIDKVIKAILKKDKNVFSNYFLMVDEIDTLQSNNKLRGRISNVIDYYFKFKIQKRALVSATINEFSHPFLKNEPLTIFDYKEPEKRNINLIYSKTINKTLAEKIISIVNNSPKKIVITYNSISNILHTIKLLSKDLQDKCGIMCSDVSKAEVEQYDYYTSLDKGILKRQITFMTSSYFAGIDIKDECHLISVSNVSKTFAILSLNTITQIHGRFRKGVISDTIIYNTFKVEARDVNKYKDRLMYKAERVVNLLNIIETTVASENADDPMDINNLNVLFKRIIHLILENADERLLNRESYPLARRNIKKKIGIAYFNIDDICYKMQTFIELYSDIKSLYNVLKESHNVNIEYAKKEQDDNVKITKCETDQSKQKFIQEILRVPQQEIIKLSKDKKLNHNELDSLIRDKRDKTQYEKEFYKRVKAHYQFIEINALADNLLNISSGNKKNYRNLKNTFAFWVLDKKHPFKNQVLKAFKKGEKYSPQQIEEILSPIINYHFFKIITRSRLVNHFKCYFKCTYTDGKYLIKKENPLDLPKPLKIISANEINLKDYFEI